MKLSSIRGVKKSDFLNFPLLRHFVLTVFPSYLISNLTECGDIMYTIQNSPAIFILWVNVPRLSLTVRQVPQRNFSESPLRGISHDQSTLVLFSRSRSGSAIIYHNLNHQDRRLGLTFCPFLRSKPSNVLLLGNVLDYVIKILKVYTEP